MRSFQRQVGTSHQQCTEPPLPHSRHTRAQWDIGAAIRLTPEQTCRVAPTDTLLGQQASGTCQRYMADTRTRPYRWSLSPRRTTRKNPRRTRLETCLRSKEGTLRCRHCPDTPQRHTQGTTRFYVHLLQIPRGKARNWTVAIGSGNIQRRISGTLTALWRSETFQGCMAGTPFDSQHPASLRVRTESPLHPHTVCLAHTHPAAQWGAL